MFLRQKSGYCPEHFWILFHKYPGNYQDFSGTVQLRFVLAKTGGVLSTGNIETDVGQIAVVRDNLDNEKAEFFGRLDNDKVELLGLLSFKKAWSSS